MAEQINDGGPAFPNGECSQCGTDHAPIKHQFMGMSLRDYFAAKALVGMLMRPSALPTLWFSDLTKSEGHPAAVKNSHLFIVHADVWAGGAYKLADAMLAARSTQHNPQENGR